MAMHGHLRFEIEGLAVRVYSDLIAPTDVLRPANVLPPPAQVVMAQTKTFVSGAFGTVSACVQMRKH